MQLMMKYSVQVHSTQGYNSPLKAKSTKKNCDTTQA